MRVWQRTIDECGADVSVSAVRVMVRELNAEIIEPAATAMIPQVHLPGRTAEVDFGVVWVIVGGAKLRAKMFAMGHSETTQDTGHGSVDQLIAVLDLLTK